MAQVVQDFTSGTWDTWDVRVLIDQYEPQLWSNGDLFTATYDNDNVTIQTDVKGHGIAVIHHNGQASLTVTISALDAYWNTLLNTYAPENIHVIDITTPVEHLHTESAYLPKLPDMNSGNDAPTRALAYKCINLVAEPAPTTNA